MGAALGQKVISPRLLAAGVVASVVPDLDVIGYQLGVSYGSVWAHRGFTHSLGFAALLAAVGLCFSRQLHAGRLTAFLFLFVATASHGVLDAFTNGGSGIAFLWPFSSERYFAPVQIIEVSPIRLARFFSSRGAEVLRSEALWIWLPCLAFALSVYALGNKVASSK